MLVFSLVVGDQNGIASGQEDANTMRISFILFWKWFYILYVLSVLDFKGKACSINMMLKVCVFANE